MLRDTIIRLSRFVPQFLRSRLAASSYGNLARRALNRVNHDPQPVADLCGPLAGQRMRVNWASHKTYVFGTHEPHIMQIIRDVVRPGWTAVDVGANIGYSTLLLARCVGPAGRVLAFEPLAENFRMLQENIRLNDHRNVTAENLALMERTGRIELRTATPGAMTWAASATIDAAKAVETQDVEAVTLDEYAIRNGIAKIDFLKMDVEGAEADVLAGMGSILDRQKPLLLIEIHQSDLFGENHPALCKLREHNYQISDLGTRGWERHVLATAAMQS